MGCDPIDHFSFTEQFQSDAHSVAVRFPVQLFAGETESQWQRFSRRDRKVAVDILRNYVFLKIADDRTISDLDVVEIDGLLTGIYQGDIEGQVRGIIRGCCGQVGTISDRAVGDQVDLAYSRVVIVWHEGYHTKQEY